MFGSNARVLKVMEEAIAALKEQGATVIDPVTNFPARNRLGDAEGTVMSYEFKADINAYLAARGPDSPMKTLADLIDFNNQHKAEEMPWFGQELFTTAQTRGPLTDQSYVDALAKCRQVARHDGIDAVMDDNQLDALIAPTEGPAGVIDYVYAGEGRSGVSSTWAAAVAGYPHVTVPCGMILGLPMNISFFGRAYSEATLLKLAFAFEQETKIRQVPKFLPLMG
jgi:amidase